jgi:hypothetical protein
MEVELENDPEMSELSIEEEEENEVDIGRNEVVDDLDTETETEDTAAVQDLATKDKQVQSEQGIIDGEALNKLFQEEEEQEQPRKTSKGRLVRTPRYLREFDTD